MARRRVIDWKKISRKLRNKPFIYRDMFKGIFACADDYGLCLWSVLDIARAFLSYELDHGQVSLKKCETALDDIMADADPTFISWQENGERYIATIKHQDYQHIRTPGNADCPCPPVQLLQKLSKKTTVLILKNLQKFTSLNDPDLQNFSKQFLAEEEDEEEDEDEVIALRKKFHTEIVKIYSEGYEKLTGEKPVIGASDGKTLKDLLNSRRKEGKAWFEKVKAVVRYAVSGAEAPQALQVIVGKSCFNRIMGKLAMGAKQ